MNSSMSEPLYCILPSGNASEFSSLDQELRRRGVKASYWDLDGGGRIYRIQPEDFSKLPSDEEGPYLGDDNSGYSLYKMPDPAHNIKRWPGEGWFDIILSEDNLNAS